MTIHQTLLFLIALSALSLQADDSKAAGEIRQHPNLILIVTDNQNPDLLGTYGNSVIQTPNIDELAIQGVRYTSAHAVSGVCSPSRAGLMTGCYPKRVGLATGSWHDAVLFPKDPHGLNPKEKTIASVLKDAGYATGCFGKASKHGC